MEQLSNADMATAGELVLADLAIHVRQAKGKDLVTGSLTFATCLRLDLQKLLGLVHLIFLPEACQCYICRRPCSSQTSLNPSCDSAQSWPG